MPMQRLAFLATLSLCARALTALESASIPIQILDDDPMSTIPGGIVHFVLPAGYVSSSSVEEGDTGTLPYLVTLRRSGGSSGEISVRCETISGGATPGQDYVAVDTHVVWTDGDVSDKTVPIAILGDATGEPAEAFSIRLRDPTGGAVIQNSALPLLVWIAENDGYMPPAGPGSLSWSVFGASPPSSTCPEGDAGTSLALLQVFRTAGTVGEIQVDFASDAAASSAIAGIDYTPVSGTLVWPDGDSAPKSIAVPIHGNSTWNISKTIIVTLSNPTNGATVSQSSGWLSIADDDPISTATHGVLSFSTDHIAVPEGSALTTLNVTVLRSGGTSGTVSCDVESLSNMFPGATAGVDYVATPSTLTWNDGDAAPKTFTIGLIGDGHWEENEAFSLVLRNAMGGAPISSQPIVPLTFDGPQTWSLQLGAPFLMPFMPATGHARAYSITRLPPGLALDPLSGWIYGTPTAVGTTVSNLTATNELGSASTIITWTVQEPGSPSTSGSSSSSSAAGGGGGCGAGVMALVILASLTRLVTIRSSDRCS